MEWFSPIVSWYLTTLLITIAVAPITMLMFRTAPDRGASIARPVGALLVVWPVWLLASASSGIVPFSANALTAFTIVFVVISWILTLRFGAISWTGLRSLVLAELGFVLGFSLFLGFHGFGPAIAGEEKLSDLMMLSSTMRADQMPPQDAWLANETTNYYYIGYAVWAAIAHLAGTIPVETYNLALATGFGMTVVAIAGAARTMLGRVFQGWYARVGGGLAVLFVVAIGNPWAFMTFVQNPSEEWRAAQLLGQNQVFRQGLSWQSTRIIFDNAPHDPITEFPAFTFLLSDLHPHLIAFPFTVAALRCGWMMLTLNSRPDGTWVLSTLLARAVVCGVLIGALYGMNSWDLPTYLGIGLIGLVIGTWQRPWAHRVIAPFVLALTAVVAWLPFHLHFEGPTRPAEHMVARLATGLPLLGDTIASVALFDADRTSVIEYLSMFGFTYVVALALVLVESWQRRSLFAGRRMQGGVVSAIIMLVVLAVVLPAPLVAVLGVPVLFIGLCLFHDRALSPGNASLGLFGVAFLLTLGPEFFYIRDFFDARMNTVFKIYFQVWLLMGIAAGVAVIVLWSVAHRRTLARVLLVGSTAAILLAGLTYPAVAGKQWLDWRSPEREWVGIDGLAYLDVPTRPGEYEALNWLWEHGKDDDVMLSAGGCEFSTLVGRPAAVAGIPTILGWPNHEVQWHLAPGDDRDNISERIADINALFDTPDPALLDAYGITLIYVGNIELQGGGREPAWDCAPGPFANATNSDYPGAGWTMVLAEGDVRIYRRDGS